MRVDLFLTPQHVDEIALRDRIVVVIDVLRASTTITTALRNGARQVIPATSVESAVKISGNLFGDVFLLGGERNGRTVEGFSLGNSPIEYAHEKVGGKSIIFSSTNGSQALVKGRYASVLLVCGFVNVSAVADVLRGLGGDFTILCAGNNGTPSLEDSVCAGTLLQTLTVGKTDSLTLTDGGHVALALHKAYGKQIEKMLLLSEHGRFLKEIGNGADLKVCAGIDTIPAVPQLEGGVLKLRAEGPPAPARPEITARRG